MLDARPKPPPKPARRRRPRRPTSRASCGSRAKAAAGPPSASRTRRSPSAAYRPLRAGYITHGSVVIAAITSCTNTSNPSVMVAAGLLAKKAVEHGLDDQALGQGQPRARLEGRHRLPPRRRARHLPRPAPVQPGRLRLHDLHRQLGPAAARDLRGDPRRRPGRGRRAVAATATSRAGSTPRSAPTTWPRRRWSSPTPWPARWTSTCRTSRSATTTTASRSTSRDIWPTPARGPGHDPASRSGPRCSRRSTARSSRATSAGTRCRCPRATSTSGTTPRPTSRTRPTSTA